MSYAAPQKEPIAVVGSSCRFAGGVTSPSKLWDLLQSPPDLSREVPPSRFNVQGFYHPDGEYHGTTNAARAYWLDQDHRVFDASFFNITPKEAEAIDPQQRMLLEVVYEALESAGYTLRQYAGQNVGVYAGVMTADYDTLSQRDDLHASQYYATGNARSIISNRVSYFFNFNGPSMTIDTACSSSLVALHQAVLSLRAGESVMACVTGVNLMITPEQFIVESNLHMLSPTGRCRMWDADADGYARGEGVAALLLKPLSQALADGDHIDAIIRETGVNSDGRTKGITMPSPEAQSRLIRETYKRAGLDLSVPADRCQYFEAHGTGTHAGDPREAAAIREAFFGREKQLTSNGSPETSLADVRVEPVSANSGSWPGGVAPNDSTDISGDLLRDEPTLNRTTAPTTSRKPDLASSSNGRLLVGSVKTIIGHTEGAAGLAGVLKVIQAMRHDLIPPNLHLERLNPSVEPFYDRLLIPTHAEPWPGVGPGMPKRASVNSFGFGGTNSHAIVESYEPAVHDGVARQFCRDFFLPRDLSGLSLPAVSTNILIGLPLLLSANSQKSLAALVENYRSFVGQNELVSADVLAWNTYARRTALPFKVAISGSSTQDMLQQLDVLAAKAKQPATASIGFRSRPGDARPRILGIFTGQGAQWATMSKGLLATSNVYRHSITALDGILKSCSTPPPWSLEQEIMAEGGLSRLGQAAISQPLCTALQIAMVDLLRSLGVSFACVIGHSSGEIAAAYAAGRLSARDAILVSYYRGLYAHLASGTDGAKGGMLAVGLSKPEAAELCARKDYRDSICVAASNAPSSVTLSGELNALHHLRDHLADQNVFARLLQVDTAYHSPHMEAPASRYLEILDACKIFPLPGDDRTIWVSSVYGFGEPKSMELISTYWRDNMVQPVLFYEAIQTALQQHGPFDCAIEVGPHPALKGPAVQTMKATLGNALPYSGVLDRKQNDAVALSSFLGFMWARFGPESVDLKAFVEQSSQPQLVSARLREMPSYPWDHSQIHYRESRLSRQYHFRTHAPHELLGNRTRDDNEFELRWRNILKLDKVPWIEHHKFQGQALLPASGYCVMAFDAARVALGGRTAAVIELEQLEFLSGIIIEPESPGVEVLFSLTVLPSSKEEPVIEATFTLTSALADGITPMKKNFAGRLRIVLGEPVADALPPRPQGQAETLPVSTDGFYHMMKETGLDYSGPFRALTTIERRFNFSSAMLRKRHDEDTTNLLVSPATLDSCLQSAFTSYCSPGDKALWTSFLPKTIERVRFSMAICDTNSERDSMLSVDTYLTGFKPISKDGAANFTGDICIYNQSGDLEIQVEGLTVASFAATRPENDHELYLHTIMDVDPEDEIVSASLENFQERDLMLVESCERVATFYLVKSLPRDRSVVTVRPVNTEFSLFQPPTLQTVDQRLINAWPGESKESLNAFIRSSPYYFALDFVRTLGENLPDVLTGMIPSVVAEAQQQLHFQKHLSRVVRQISHRYPRMNVLGLTDPELGLTEHALDGLASSFLSYTIGSEAEPNLAARLQVSESYRRKIITEKVDISALHPVEASSAGRYDMVILSTSIFQTQKSMTALRNIRQMMKSGGFLLLVHVSRSPLKDRIRRCAGAVASIDSVFTPPDWPDVLDKCDFAEHMRGANQYYAPGFSLVVRQVACAEKQLLLQPLSSSAAPSLLTSKLLIVGGKALETSVLFDELQRKLSPHCGAIIGANTLDDVDRTALLSCTAAIILADLDEPVLSTMTESRLEVLRALVKPNAIILWLTQNARTVNPDHAASFGFGRTLLAETPGLVLQMLDLESMENASTITTDAFARLALTDLAERARGGEFLWAPEPEVHIENGRRLVPRVMPYSPGNKRANAPRRVVSDVINTLETCVEIVSTQSVDGTARYDTKLNEQLPRIGSLIPDQVMVQVYYSSIETVNLDWAFSSHVCIGRNTQTGEAVITLSKSNASFICVPSSCVKMLPDVQLDLRIFLGILIRVLVSLSICAGAREKSVVLVDPDEQLVECASHVLPRNGKSLRVCATQKASLGKDHCPVVLHPRASSRELRTLFPPDGATVFDFLPESSGLSEMLVDALPENCEYHSRYALLQSEHLGALDDIPVIDNLLERAIAMSLDILASQVTKIANSAVSVPDLTRSSGPIPPFQLLDWRAERAVAHVVQPTAVTQVLRPYKTYALIGLTRDLGQSLCRLFVEHGARNIVLASRNPNKSPRWRDELAAQGVNIRIEAVDVTDLGAILAFKAALEETMPPVAGVVNGAMVLDDRVFSQMTLETLHRVMRPKTVGSRNLDIAFCDPNMEFFIMTSSFAAIGGHAGQSNYAAANMYMNGLAASRHARGLPGSALNIGVIYGLGFLHREREELYSGLEREGYPPISERDVHHMFLEAIVAGRPMPGQIADLTTGLRRYRVDDPNPLHWHRDPRFSHYTLQNEDGDDAETAGESAKEGSAVQGDGAVKAAIESADAAEEVAAALVPAFARRLESLLQCPRDSITADSGIAELGVDSLVAVEIRSWMWKVVGRDVAVLKILGAVSLVKLCAEIAEMVIADRIVSNVTVSKATPRPDDSIVIQPLSPSGSASSLGSHSRSHSGVETPSTQLHFTSGENSVNASPKAVAGQLAYFP